MTIRFHLDEHIHPGILAGLRAHGIDVTATNEISLDGADDLQHIAFALAGDRVIVTHDEDFLKHNAAGIEHAGIAYCHQDKYSVGGHLQVLLLLHACYSAAEMHGKVEFL